MQNPTNMKPPLISVFVWSFMSLCISSLNVCDAFPTDNLLAKHNVKELSYRDQFNLHHAFVVEEQKWESGVISFKIDSGFTNDEIRIILFAMFEIESSSCIRFVAHDPRDGPNYVMITARDPNSCKSTLGFANEGEQTVNLGTGCVTVDTVVHELLHTIGFSHHHERSDRDKFITIHPENANNSAIDNFYRAIEYDERMRYLTPFDFNSIMMYREDGFSINNESVITSKISGAKIQPSDGLSENDKILLNQFYDCQSLDRKTSKIFYEKVDGLHFIVNYHEIERAKQYLVSGRYVAIAVGKTEPVGDDKVENPTIDKEHNETLIVEYPELFPRWNLKNETERKIDQALEDIVFDANENDSNNTQANLVTYDDDDEEYFG